MKVKDLIAALKKMDGNLEVYGVSDHGQAPEKVSSPQEIWLEKSAHTIWDGEYLTDEEEAEDEGYKVKAVLL